MNPNEDGRAWADSVGIAIEQIIGPVEGMHRAVVDPWLRLLSPGAAQLHSAALTKVYGSVRFVASKGAAAAGSLSVRANDQTPRATLSGSKFATATQAFTNGVWGDELERRRSPAHIELSLRDVAGNPVSPSAEALVDAFPHPTGRLVVLLHGLGQTEAKWQTRSTNGQTQPGLADVLEGDGLTPLLVRYNSGRHVPDTAADLAKLLDEVYQAWRVPIHEIAVVGFSMGGLVARNAVRAGHEAGHAWTTQVRHVVTLATPHLGSPIEKGANFGAWALGLATKTKPLSDFVNTRSLGIKDLRHGTSGQRGTATDDPLPGGIQQHFLAGVTTASPANPFGRLVGDFVVRPNSGTGQGRRRELQADDARVIEGVRHTGLFYNPQVHEQVQDWLSPIGEQHA